MSRHRILRRVRGALESRARVDHPGPFVGARPAGAPNFDQAFTAAGGEVVRCATLEEARLWLAGFSAELGSVCVGPGVPAELHPALPRARPGDAALGVSVGIGAVAETGSLVLSAEDGRRVQILPPVHVVAVAADRVFPSLAEALAALEPEFGSAAGLHSGPSKSADIGQILVQGVHGPGRLVALLVAGLHG